MGAALTKIGPMIAISGLTGYCLMPYLTTPPLPRDPVSTRPARIEASLLSPSLDPPLERNPFESRAIVASPLATGTARTKAAASNQSVTLPDLHLGATMVHGRRRCAVINGRVYGEGDALKGTAPDTPPVTLARVEHDRVWLGVHDRSGQPPTSVALDYAPFGTKPPPSQAGVPDSPPAATTAGEAGDLAHLTRLANPAEIQAFVTIARGLLGNVNVSGMSGMPPAPSVPPAGAPPGRSAARWSRTP